MSVPQKMTKRLQLIHAGTGRFPSRSAKAIAPSAKPVQPRSNVKPTRVHTWLLGETGGEDSDLNEDGDLK